MGPQWRGRGGMIKLCLSITKRNVSVPVSALVFVEEEDRSVSSEGCTVHIRVLYSTAHTVWIGVVQCNKHIKD